MARGSELLLAPRRPPPVIAVLIAIAAAAVATALVYPLKAAAPVVSLGVVYLLAVLLVSTYVGFAAGLLTALLSTVAFNFFHLPPLYRLTLADSEYWVALAGLRDRGRCRQPRCRCGALDRARRGSAAS